MSQAKNVEIVERGLAAYSGLAPTLMPGPLSSVCVLLKTFEVAAGAACFAGYARRRRTKPVFLSGRLHDEDDLAVFFAEVIQSGEGTD